MGDEHLLVVGIGVCGRVTVAFSRLDLEVMRVMVMARIVMAVMEMVVAMPWSEKWRVLDFVVVDQT